MRLIPAEQKEAVPKPEVPTVRMPSFKTSYREREPRVLDFDVETVAAGFADPQWVPQKITCVAWSWADSDEVNSLVCGPLGLFGATWLRSEMLAPLLEAIRQADYVTGHNLERFDLPVINAECMRLDLPPIREVVVQDTMRVFRSKGFKKGQDNLGRLYRLTEQKMALDWQAWQDGYDEVGDLGDGNLDHLLHPNNDDTVWKTIRHRAVSDVEMHKELRLAMIDRDVLKKPRPWRSLV